MSRSDLQALTADDLAALANRGLVKRAQKEVEAGDPTVEWDEAADGTLTAIWSDGVTCTLPGGQTVSEALCSCPALELCRHVLRTVLAWQRDHDGGEEESATEWDPGSMTDEALQAQISKPVLARAGDLWSKGVLAELLRGRKPSARFHTPGHTVRFPVPADLRYAQCSCPEPSPCVHAVLAVRAFRLLPAETSAGIINEGAPESPVASGPLDIAVRCVAELLEEGFATLGTPWRDKVRRAAAECHAAGLPWPAGILEELAGEFDRYVARDGAFTPATACSLAGELLLRIDAIRSGRAPVPQAFLRGSASDRDEELGGARFVGLGSSIRQSRTATTLHVYLQDCTSGHVVTLEKSFTDDPAKPKPYHELARATAVKDASLALLAAGQLVTQGGRRTATGRLVIGRARAVVNPQDFSWEQLKAPVLVDDFGELAARLRLLPPASFRPRQAMADFHVCPVASVVEAAFDPASNSIVAILADHDGRYLELRHPWSERGAQGAEALLSALLSGRQPHFVAGQVKSSAHHFTIRPTAFVLAGESGPRRGVLPWTDPGQQSTSRGIVAGNRLNRARYHAVHVLLEEVLINGLRRTHSRNWPSWAAVADELEVTGCHRMAKIVTGAAGAAAPLPSMLVLLKILALEGEAAPT